MSQWLEWYYEYRWLYADGSCCPKNDGDDGDGDGDDDDCDDDDMMSNKGNMIHPFPRGVVTDRR